VTLRSGQYELGISQPSVTPRLRIHSTFWQNPLAEGTSMKPTQNCASALPEATNEQAARAPRRQDLKRIDDLPGVRETTFVVMFD
jgi:hypothetical protein